MPSPSPNCPWTFCPHPQSVPSVRIARVGPLPDAVTLAHVASVPTCVGEERFTVSSKPKLPLLLLLPQAQSVPSVLIANDKDEPEEAVDHPVSVPTWTGEERATTSPVPSPPVLLYPHVHSVPSVFIATPWNRPVPSRDHVARVPSCVGEERSTLSPSPS